jgi:hypothetical protein
MTIIETLIKRQETLSLLYSPANTEVYTPIKLVKEMLDKLPVEVWSNPELKFCDPAVKSGVFLSEILIRLMKGLKNSKPNEKKRYIYIVKNMLYGYTTSELSYKVVQKLLMLENRDIKHNIFNINFLEEKKNMKFDVIVGNPPYNLKKDINKSDGGFGGRNIQWDKFVVKSFDILKEGGYLCFIHPSLWRKPEQKLWDILTNKNIKYLEIHGINDGLKVFRVGTRYDWYILQNIKYQGNTIIIDENGNKFNINLKDWRWIPNYNLETIKKILAKDGEETCDILYDRSAYGSDKIHMSRKEIGKFKYKCIHSINNEKNGGIIYMYSNTNKNGFFNDKKIIVNGTLIARVYNDYKAEYAFTDNCFAIKIKNENEGNLLCKAMNTKKFKEVIRSTKWSNFRTDWRMFKYFKKDFWKYFVDENGNEI